MTSLARRAGVLVLAGLTAAFAACSQEEPKRPESPPAAESTPAPTVADIDGTRIVAADAEPESWLSYGRTYSEQRYSPLDQIDTESVSRLGFVWEYETLTNRGLEASPIVVDGRLFATGSWSTVYALDAKTGAELWHYDPKVPGKWGRYACCDVVNRGVAVWKGRVYVGTLDGRLVALDAATGKVDWEVDTIGGEVPYTITGAPRVVKDKVIIGNGGAEYGARGFVTAYDAATGERVWRIYTVPGDPSKPFESPELEKAAATWAASEDPAAPKWWEIGGGGTAWDSMAYDPDLDLLYVGTGNGSPWNRWVRSPGGGDNLFLASILALNPDTGAMAWYYQVVPGDTWDFTATQHIMLAELEIGGRERKVLMQAPKDGFFYVLDRATGELLSAEPFVKVTWASHVDLATGRPVENADLLYKDGPSFVQPGPAGGHNWQPMAFSPQTGLVYIPALDAGKLYSQEESFRFRKGSWNRAIGGAVGASGPGPGGAPAFTPPPSQGMLEAFDPATGTVRWKIDHPVILNGGVLATAGGLVFQGTGDGRLLAVRADTGEILKEIAVKGGILAPPVTYAVEGRQYIAVLSGWGGAGIQAIGPGTAIETYGNEGRVLAFALDGAPEVPGEPLPPVRVPEPPPAEGDAALIAQGFALYDANCAMCHTAMSTPVHRGVVPDLRLASASTYAELEAIVLRGAREAGGMPNLSDVLGADDVAAVRAFLIDESWKAYRAQEAAGTP
ncbi:MAG: PQQ-dependent dehydrogenase, methanol/ethanol family [Alphaproteobacteria bacterium]|nr:PQQ-dependent dehydrogenase, methanol/ethanol family [Alphaproteobacteria bacterium]